ncbi:hypothetical protein PG995_006007 [Apiospora arundinis]
MSRRLSEPCGDIGPNEPVTSHSTVPPNQAWPYRIPVFPLKMPVETGGGPDAGPTSSTLPDPSSNITSSAVDNTTTTLSLGKGQMAGIVVGPVTFLVVIAALVVMQVPGIRSW